MPKPVLPSKLACLLLWALASALAACGDDDDGGAGAGPGGGGSSGASQGGSSGAAQGGSSGAGAGQGGSSGEGAGRGGASGSGQGGTGGSAGSGGAGGLGGAAGAGGQGGGSASPIDPTFGTDGFVSLDDVPGFAALLAMSVGADGHIDVLGLDPLGYQIVVRLLADGRLDESFGHGGVVDVVVPDFFTTSIVAQPDGKVVVGGVAIDFYLRASFWRLNADGTPDPSFGVGGYSSPPLQPAEGRAFRMAFGDDGRVFAVGTGGLDFALDAFATRVLPDGSLDPSFHAPDGFHIYEPGAPHFGDAYMFGAHVAPDGSSYSCGSALGDSSYDFLVLRYAPDGTLDPGFREGGALLLPHESSHGAFRLTDNTCSAVAEAPDGKVVFGGRTQSEKHPILSDFVLVRTLHDGALDPSFGRGGIVELGGSEANALTDLLVLPDGSIAAAGYAGEFDALSPTVTRLRADGTPDPAFGDGGVFALGPPGATDDDHKLDAFLGAQPDGKLVVGVSDPKPLIARLRAP